MKLSIKQAAQKAGKTEQTIRNWIKAGKIKAHKVDGRWQVEETSLNAHLSGTNKSQGKQEITVSEEVISQIVDRVVSQVLSKIEPVIREALEKKQDSPAEKEGDQQEKIRALEKENEDLKERVNVLENQVQALKADLSETLGKLEYIERRSESEIPEMRPKKKENVGVRDEERAERWVRNNIEEWLDKPSRLKKAPRRTWRDLAENRGDKILIKNREQCPRAYLHVIENGNGDVSTWAKMKAKVVLEITKEGDKVRMAGV